MEAAVNSGSKMQHQLEQLRSKAARAELRQSEVLGRKAEFLSNTLYPNKLLQEREIGGIYFAARHGVQLLHDLYDNIRTDCLDHQIVWLNNRNYFSLVARYVPNPIMIIPVAVR